MLPRHETGDISLRQFRRGMKIVFVSTMAKNKVFLQNIIQTKGTSMSHLCQFRIDIESNQLLSQRVIYHESTC